MSRAGTSVGTARRTRLERAQLLAAARRDTPGFAELPPKMQRKVIAELHARTLR